jgi:TRAP-type uncharacterized transport system fused permease subunit
MWPFFKSLLQQAQIAQSRSSVINPLQWTLLILVVLLLALVTEHERTPPWLLVSAAVATGAVLLLLMTSYIYFMRTNPDALRSETFSIVKTALEKKYLGDSLTGLREIVDTLEGSERRALGPGEGQDHD